ncbi:zf-HC2 domain-containing protein [candidate division KSB1 bacterium]|nr:zf-HC2 domain-containing protein [candidate division KSB1 bacterium]
MSSACKEIQDQLAGYVDQEIEPAQASTITQHLGKCPGCAQEASVQSEVKTLVREHAKQVPAPAHVRVEIRRTLERESSRFGFLSQLLALFQRQPLPAIVTVLVLIFLSGLITHYFFPSQTNLRGSDEQFVDGSIEGEIICVDCTLMDVTKTPYVHDFTHRAGLRCKDGKLWSILPSEQGRELARDPSRFHRQVRLVGHLFQSLRYIEVKEFSLI